MIDQKPSGPDIKNATSAFREFCPPSVPSVEAVLRLNAAYDIDYLAHESTFHHLFHKNPFPPATPHTRSVLKTLCDSGEET